MIPLRATHNRKIYPIRYFDGYTLAESKRIYREMFNLKYKRNVVFYNLLSSKIFN